MRQALLACTVTCLGIVLLLGGRTDPASASGDSSVSVLAYDEQARVMVEGDLDFLPDWACFSCGDPLTLKDSARSAAPADAKEAQGCPEGTDPAAAAAYARNFAVMLRAPDATRSCSFPLAPVGAFYRADLPDGGIVLLQLPEDAQPSTVLAGYKGEVYSLFPVSTIDVARLQLAGDPPGTDPEKAHIITKVARADNLSLIAFTDEHGQAEALMNAAEVVVAIEEVYRERHEQYSHTMCQLYAGPNAVISAVPRNPYDFDRNLCETEYGMPRPAGALRYIPEVIGDTPERERVVGYWLAVLGSGPTVDPVQPLPADCAMPLRAIHWFETHPEAAE